MYNSYVHNATISHQKFLVWHSILTPNPKRRQFALFSVSILLLWETGKGEGEEEEGEEEEGEKEEGEKEEGEEREGRNVRGLKR